MTLTEGEIAVDPRFVRMVPANEIGLVPESDHSIALVSVGDTLYAEVVLYKTHGYCVRLGEVPDLESTFEVHEFSADRSGNKRLTLEDLARRAFSKSNTQGAADE